MLTETEREQVENFLNSDIKNRHIKLNKQIKKYGLEKQANAKRDALTLKHPKITMKFFIQAMALSDFEAMKHLLPHMFNMHVNLHEIYLEVLREESNILTPNEKARAVHKSLVSCQKNLVHIKNYKAEDVWLLVMLESLRPMSALLPCSDNFLLGFRGCSDLTYNNKNLKEKVTQYQLECEAVNAKIITLTQCYHTNKLDLLNKLPDEEKKLKKLKDDMTWWNTLFNIINVFAWLPLLLRDLKINNLPNLVVKF